jgi:hypothetical protein
MIGKNETKMHPISFEYLTLLFTISFYYIHCLRNCCHCTNNNQAKTYILSILNTLLYFLQLLFVISISITFVTVVTVVIVVTVFIISIIFVIVVISSVIVAIAVDLIGIVMEERQNIRNDNVNHR